MLLSVYQGIDKTEFRDMYCVDIAKGLKADRVPWMRVLDDFLRTENPPLSRKAYDCLYPVLKSLFHDMRTDDSLSYRYKGSVADAFVKMLLITRKVSHDDWNLLAANLRSPKNLSDFILDVSELSLSEEAIEKFATELLAYSELDSITCLAVSRLLETTKKSQNLSQLALNLIAKKQVKHEVSGIFEFWYMLKNLAEKGHPTPEIHQNLICYISKVCFSQL
jgi:hypothetical protein